MDRPLKGRVALVTGASRGIGKAIAADFVRAGAQVMITSRKEDSLREAVAEIGERTQYFVANSGDSEAADLCVLTTLERFGRLDILVNNAATNPHYGRMIEIDSGKFDKTVQVNLSGPLFWSQAAWRHSFVNRPGVIINISSSGATKISDNLGAYCTTKVALNHLTRQLAYELAPTRVVAVAPGLIQTDFSKELVGEAAVAKAARIPVRRLGVPEDIAPLVTFLASESAAFLSGEVIVVDGGASVVPN